MSEVTQTNFRESDYPHLLEVEDPYLAYWRHLENDLFEEIEDFLEAAAKENNGNSN